jgi:hypothetical protein
MNLEQRVQALELEVQVLKNQIQATLLDIREQLLNGTYPALRGEDSSPEPSAAPSPASAASQPVVTRPSDSSNADVPVAGHVRQVSLKDIQAPDFDEDAEEAVIPNYPAPPAASVLAPRPTNGSSTSQVSEVPDDPPVRRMPRTDHRRALPEDRSMTESELSALPFITDTDDAPPFITPSDRLTEADWASLALLESWTSHKVQELGARRTRELIKMYTVQGRFDAKIRDALLQLVTIVSEEGGPPADQLDSRAFPQPVAASHTGPQAELPPQNMILKLIAGVQSAGTHKGRRKNRG